METTYYSMKKRMGGIKLTVREKLCFKWYPTPGCIMHDHPRRDRVFERHYNAPGNKSNLVYWRMHPKEWDQVRAGTNGRKIL